ncbi:hypothetical protein Tco_1165719 [Tanacetum coccineum]
MVAYLKKTKGSKGFHQIVDFLNSSHIRYALIENPTIYVSLIQQFWNTATARTLDNGEIEITATIDGKVKIVSKASIRRHLKLEDSDGISNFPSTEIFKQLALMGVDPFGDRLTSDKESLWYCFYKAYQKEVQERHEHDMESDFKFTAAEEVYTAEKKLPKTKLQLEQERLGYEEALRLHAEIDEEERQRIARVQEEASSFNIEEWDDIQARVEADEEFAQRLQSKEREMYSKAKKSRLLAKLINERKRYFAAQRAEERRNKPLTQAQQRTYMSQYIKNIGSHTLKKLKSYSFDEIKNLFEITIRRVHTFVPMESESERVILELAARSSKREAEEELVQESSKRLKTGERSVPAEESKDKEEEEELSQERILQMMIIVLEHGMNVEALQTKYPIIDWEIYTKGARKEDFVKLWSLVKEKFTSAELTECWKHKKYRSLPSCNRS